MALRQADALQHPVEDRWDQLIQPGRVHRTMYTDPDIFELEMRKVFGGTWMFLGHDTEIPEPHDFVTKRMGLRPIILTRDGNGDVHALINRCTHRGAQVCREDHGRKKFFTCGYHCWTYKSDGECVGIPQPKAYGPDFKLSDKRLGKIPLIENYRGFNFGTLNPDMPPLKEHLKGALEYFDYWIDRNANLRVQANCQRYINHCNWKCIYDNAGDGYHPPYSHESMLSMRTLRYESSLDMTYFGGADTDDGPMYAMALGNGHTFFDQRPEMYAEGRSAWESQPPQPGREAFEAQLVAKYGKDEAVSMLDANMGAGMNLTIFPNLMLVGNQIQVMEPLTVTTSQMAWYATLRDDMPAEVNALRMRSQEDFPIFGEVDDSANFESCHAGMYVPEMEWVDIGRHMDKDETNVDDQGRIKQPASSDIHMRHYYGEVKRLLKADLNLTLG